MMEKSHRNGLARLTAAVLALSVAPIAVPAALAKHPAQTKQHHRAANSNIVQYAAAQRNLKTLVAAVKAADLVGTLSGKGPFTVFAPTDTAFAKLPKGTLESLLQPENKSKLAAILTYHVVSDRVLSGAVAKLIRQGGGEADIATVEGGKIIAELSGNTITLTDENGGRSAVTLADLRRSNGVIHVIDTVLLPKT